MLRSLRLLATPYSSLATVSLLLASLLPFPASAQVATETPPFGSFGGGPDIINLANLNSHITIPVLHKPGRGTNFTYDLSYDSSVWYPVTSNGTTSWQSVSNWGWRGQTEVATGYESFVLRRVLCDVGLYGYARSSYVYHDAFGAGHSFPNAFYDGCGDGTLTDTTVDGSGYSIKVPGGAITSSSGKIFNPPKNTTSGTGNFTDRNGNQITVDSSGHFYDTLNSTTPVLTVTGGAPNPLVFTYSAPSGANASYTMKYTAYTVKTNFGCSSIAEYGPTSNNLVSEIDLPDNSKYTFSYETTPGYSGDVTGRLYQVTLPTGGTITYTYSGGNNGINCSEGSTATLTRATPDTWTYAQVKGSGAASTTTITDPQSNVTTIQFQGIYETQRVVNQGSSSTVLTTNTCYNGSATPCTGTAFTLPITQRDTTTYLPGGNLQAKHTEIYYAPPSTGVAIATPKEIDDWDYGSGAPGGMLRQILITYASLGNNLNS